MNRSFHATSIRFRKFLTLFFLVTVMATPSALAVNGVILDQQLDAGGKGYTVLRVWGSHYEMGYAHAWFLADDIVTGVEEVETQAGVYYSVLRSLIEGAVWQPVEIEDEFAGMVDALRTTKIVDHANLTATEESPEQARQAAGHGHKCRFCRRGPSPAHRSVAGHLQNTGAGHGRIRPYFSRLQYRHHLLLPRHLAFGHHYSLRLDVQQPGIPGTTEKRGHLDLQAGRAGGGWDAPPAQSRGTLPRDALLPR